MLSIFENPNGYVFSLPNFPYPFYLLAIYEAISPIKSAIESQNI